MREPDYKRIIESATDYAILTMDLDRRIYFWNTGAEHLMGWKREEIRGQLGDIIFPEENRPQNVNKEILDVHKYGSATDERWHVKRDGSRFWALGRMMSITDQNETIIGYVKILLDQTERRLNEQKLKELTETLEKRVKERTAELRTSRDKLRLLAFELSKAEEHERENLAADLHDNLGQILAVCRMELELFQSTSTGKTNPELDTIKNRIDDAIRYTRELMSDLKPPAGLKRENLETMMEWLAERMKKHGLKVVVEDDNQTKLLTEEVKVALLQSVRELLFNVIKHAEVGEATVRLRRAGSEVQLVVEDKGSGFDPDKMDYLIAENSGFGLFNITEKLDLLGGRLKIDSNTEGTAISLFAPLKN